MKTTRINCFETNSSSTHSLTVHAPHQLNLKPSATFLPGEDGKISVTIGDDTDYESCLHDKLNFALTFAHTIGDQAAYDRVIKVVESFTNIPVEVSTRKWENGAYVTKPATAVMEQDEDSINEAAEDVFGSYTGDYGHGSVEDFVDEGKKIVATEESILAFIFTSHCAFSRTEHYDG